MINVTGTLTDSSGVVPIEGWIQFILSSYLGNDPKLIVSGSAKVETGPDGTFSVNLDPTLPGTAEYSVKACGKFVDGRIVRFDFGTIKVPGDSDHTLDFLLDGFDGLGSVYSETPTGAIDGQNRTYSLSYPQAESSEQIYVDGVLLLFSQYTISPVGKIVLSNLILSGQRLQVYYIRADSYDADTDSRLYRDSLSLVTGTKYGFSYGMEFGTEEIYVGGYLQVPNIAYFINSYGQAEFLTEPASQPYSWYQTVGTLASPFSKRREQFDGDGITQLFILGDTPVDGSVRPFLNGQLLSGEQYSLDGMNLTINTPPPQNQTDALVVYYQVEV